MDIVRWSLLIGRVHNDGHIESAEWMSTQSWSRQWSSVPSFPWLWPHIEIKKSNYLWIRKLKRIQLHFCHLCFLIYIHVDVYMFQSMNYNSKQAIWMQITGSPLYIWTVLRSCLPTCTLCTFIYKPWPCPVIWKSAAGVKLEAETQFLIGREKRILDSISHKQYSERKSHSQGFNMCDELQNLPIDTYEQWLRWGRGIVCVLYALCAINKGAIKQGFFCRGDASSVCFPERPPDALVLHIWRRGLAGVHVAVMLRT